MRQGQREQDEAAGGRQYRELRLEDGTVVVVSAAARRYAKTLDQSYGYLQFKTNGKTVTKYIGRVTAESRAEFLHMGWEPLRSRKLAESFGWWWISKRGK